jgi:formate--tetrahydrofolate ligase
VATQMGLSLADYVVTEAGFGADLGAEKFLDIKCRCGDFEPPKVIVLVATAKALKYNGGVPKEAVKEPNLKALEKGICNLKRHYNNLCSYGIPVIITINKFNTDTAEEIDFIKQSFKNIPVVSCESFSRGGEGALDLARAVVDVINTIPSTEIRRPYQLWDMTPDKIKKLSQTIYGASDVQYSEQALEMFQKINDMGYGALPICVAKTQYSFSDDPNLLGTPEGFTLKVNEIRLCAGAGFIVVICGKIMTMPGLPKHPAAENIYVDNDNKIVGLF